MYGAFFSGGIPIGTETEKGEQKELSSARKPDTCDDLISEVSEGVFITDADGIIVFANSAFARIFGYEKAEDVKGKNPHELLSPEDDQGFARRIRGTPDTPANETPSELQITRRDGSTGYILVRPKFIIDNGRIVGARGIVRDITERRKNEESIREEKAFLARILASITDGISILDKDLTVRGVNRAMEIWYSHNMPIVGKKCYEAYHGRKEPCLICPSLRTMNEGKPCAEIVPKEDTSGKVVGWMEVNSFPLINTETGDVQGVIEYVRDLTEKKRAEDALKESETRFRTLAEHSPRAIIQADMSGKIIYCNKRFCEGLELNESQCMGDGWMQRIHPDDRMDVTVKLGKYLVAGKPFSLIFRLLLPEQRTRWISATFGPIKDERGSVRGWIGHGEDITESKMTRDRLELSEMRFRMVSECTSDLIWDWNILEGWLEWSGEIDSTLGYSRGEFPKTIEAWEKIIHPEDHDRVMAALDRHLKHGERYREEYRVIKKNGQICHWVDTGMALLDDQGRPYRMFGACTDVSLQKAVQQKILAQNELLEAVNCILRESIACETEEEVARACVKVTLHLTESDFGFICTLDAEGNPQEVTFSSPEMQPRTILGEDAGYMLQGFRHLGIWNSAISEGKTIISNDLKSHMERSTRGPEHPDIQSLLVSPIKHSKIIIGLLAMGRKSNAYGSEDMNSVENISLVLSEAIVRKRLETQLRDYAIQLERKLRNQYTKD